jgi:HD-GYP domain-containing protein (c-di-GMP phosphodiesterase class II)
MSVVLLFLSSAHVILSVLILIAIFEMKLYFKLSDAHRKIVSNCTLIVLGVSTIVFHLHTPDPEVFVDMRGVGIALATLFGGIQVGLITTLLEIAARTIFGGSVFVDSITLILDFAVVTAVIKVVASRSGGVRWSALIFSGILIGASEAAGWILNLPLERGLILFKNYGSEDFAVQLIGTLLFGWLFKMQDGRYRSIRLSIKHNAQLRLTLQSAVDALSTAMGHRDLATMGHERRVASLAVEIGKVLGLSADKLDGLHMAATVHDVGLIRAPAEILTRPRKLIPEEFELLKLHSEDGYEILKEVPFPWPIAEIVYQHHENIDGSGYPRGLRGDQLLLETRILRVCDVMEAMLSHRPFRRSFSIEKVFDELIKNKGTMFDENIVNICNYLFQEQGYKFPNYSVGMKS